ncbi:agmatinase [Methylopila jiangsuensis]|uniref:Agmatinase n=1 Tax=Methylopila jiangsuensis TaxID=586230 RepID=A0A9W6JF29_9HYPH|nr:agmatinase [Methylopila jiangsuensis]MDR6285367.1 agmatinase [Methylopila jiangsuensis]GLK75123.1 agmatinase [Methylopila jiangsuensis]
MPSDPLRPRPVDDALDSTRRYGESIEANYAGAVSFLRRPYARSAEGADAAVWGVPLDTSVSNRPGARFGPRAIREASTINVGDPAYPFGFDIFEDLAVVDTGDCALDYGRVEEMPAAIERQAAARYAAGAHLVTLGGDHYLTYPVLKALVARLGRPVALVQFDAHQDTWDDDGRRIDHGTMITRAVRDGLILPERSIQIGIRTHAPQDYGISILDGLAAQELGALATASRILGHVEEAPVYVSFDIDCLDPAYAPGTGTPVCGGVSSAFAISCLRRLGALDLKGFDIVEVSPPYDHAGVTALAGATLAQVYLGLLAEKKRAGASVAP